MLSVVKNMSLDRRKLIIITMLMLLLLGSLFGFGLEKTTYRDENEYLLPEEMIRQIAVETKDMTYREIIKYGLKATSKALHFSEKNDMINGSANCVGYSQVCSSICNYAFTINKYTYRARPVVGYVTFCGINICRILHTLLPRRYKGMVKDHDFVELELDEGIILFDPSLFDFHINATTVMRK